MLYLPEVRNGTKVWTVSATTSTTDRTRWFSYSHILWLIVQRIETVDHVENQLYHPRSIPTINLVHFTS